MPVQNLRCVICNSNETVVDKRATDILCLGQYPYSVRMCKTCDIKWLDPRPTDEEYDQIYKNSDYFVGDLVPTIYEMIVQERREFFNKRCKNIKKLIGKDSFKLLDIGAATGEFVNIARSMGIDAEGMEVSKWACEEAKKNFDLDLKCTDLFGARLPDAVYDVIHMNHVFEHLSNPVEYLRELKRILKKDGLIVLEVPYQFDNLLEKFLRRSSFKKYSLYSIHHPFFYSPKSLGNLLAKCHFELLIKNTFDLDNPTLVSTSRFKRIIKTLILWIGSHFDKGDFIEIYARSK